MSLCPNGFIPLGPKLGPCPTNRVALDPHIIFVPNRWQDDVPRFKRVFVSCAACIHVAYGCGMKFCGLDAAHSMHSVFRQGYHTFLTTRDGNNKILPLAWAICETESKETYTFFGDEVHAAGLGRYLGHKTVVYSDRQKGIEYFFTHFRAYVAKCLVHILKNARQHLRGLCPLTLYFVPTLCPHILTFLVPT